MSLEFITVIIVVVFTVVEVAGVVFLGIYLSRMLNEISTATRIHVLQGRRIEDVLRELQQPLRLKALGRNWPSEVGEILAKA
jgi:cell division protein YceG involved in septum cleavage